MEEILECLHPLQFPSDSYKIAVDKSLLRAYNVR